MAKKSEYRIGFTGLADGKHEFAFEIGKTFFEQLDYSEISDATLNVTLNLEKKQTMMLADFHIKGSVTVMCDRCTDDFSLPVAGDYNLIYKFGSEDVDDENVVVVFPHESEIDVSHPIYEFTCLLLPARRIHPEGQCNQEMLQSIDQYLMVEEKTQPKKEVTKNIENEDVDPRWAALKQLKNNKNKK